jgi:hypothetical protein
MKVEEIDGFDGRVEGVVHDDRWISRYKKGGSGLDDRIFFCVCVSRSLRGGGVRGEKETRGRSVIWDTQPVRQVRGWYGMGKLIQREGE